MHETECTKKLGKNKSILTKSAIHGVATQLIIYVQISRRKD